MQSNWTSLIRDPKSRPSAEARSQALRSMTTQVFSVLTGALVNKDLAIAPPSACPEGLGKGIAGHNERVDEFLKRRGAWVEQYAGMPLMEEQPDAAPADLIHAREQALNEQVEVFHDHRELLATRECLLGEVVEALGAEERAAADHLERERAKVGKALERAGLGAEDDPRHAQNTSGAKIRFDFKVSAAAPVRAAQEALAQARLRVTMTAEALGGIAADVAIVEALRRAALDEAVGGSC